MSRTRLHFIRHGEAYSNIAHEGRVVSGMRGDQGLTPNGIAQVERLREQPLPPHGGVARPARGELEVDPTLPVVGPVLMPSRYSRRFDRGFFQAGSTLMYVGQGIGSKSPIRIGCPPEVSRIALRVPRPADQPHRRSSNATATIAPSAATLDRPSRSP